MLYFKKRRFSKPVFLFLFLPIFFSCKREIDTTEDIRSYFPNQTAMVFETRDVSNLLRKIDSLPLFQSNPFLIPKDLGRQITTLNLLPTVEPSYLFFSAKGKDVNFSIIGKDNLQQHNDDTLTNKYIDTLLYEGYTINRYDIDEYSTFKTNKDGIFIISNSLTQVQDLIHQKRDNSTIDPDLLKVISSADPNKNSLYINHSYFDENFRKNFPGNNFPLTSLAKWSVLDFDVNNAGVLFHGIAVSGQETPMLLDIFSGTGNFPNETAKVTPASAAGFYSFTYGDFDLLYTNLKVYDPNLPNLPPDHLLKYTREAGLVTWQNKAYFILRAIDRELANEALLQGEIIKDFRGLTLYKREDDNSLFEPLSPLITIEQPTHYAWVEDFLIFSNSTEALEGIISNFLNKTTLYEQETYTESLNNLAEASSFLLVFNIAETDYPVKELIAKDNTAEAQKLNLENYSILALQFVREREFSHVHAVLSKTQSKSRKIITQKLTMETVGKPATPAFPVRNHNTGKIETVVQDEENTLYLFSSEGEMLWKLPLESRIIGTIQQVDLFNNGNLQFAFTTAYALHIIDRNGNTVRPFPLKFQDEITQPLSIYDYDNNHDYRFVITQDRDVLMYDNKGRPVKGFDYKKVESAIINPPKHIRLNNKDYIIIPEESGKLNILSRQGHHRIQVEEKIDPSPNHWYEYNNAFVTLTAIGELARVNENGKVTREPATINSNARLTVQENVLVTLSENILTINNSSITLDFGLYTEPEIFRINNSVYISITDLQAQRVYIFERNGDLLPGLPVYGNSAIQLAGDENNNVFFTVWGEDNRILLYSF